MRLIIFLAAAVALWPAEKQTALDRYVGAKDPSFRYELVSEQALEGGRWFILKLTSQNWRSAQEVDRTAWEHWLSIYRPVDVRHQTGLLFITGGSNDGRVPSVNRDLRSIAWDTKSVVAELRMVPNQPLRFTGEATPRFEDAFIAYTWDKFLRGGDDLWPARLPMTKSAVRAMDAVTAFLSSPQGGGLKVDRFVVSGGSKRGWTTWTTAAVEAITSRRVVAIIPLVIDVLNVEKSFEHHWRALGFWAPAIKDYVQMNIPAWFGHPRLHELMKIEDPYNYRERLTMPKLIVNAAGDQFFLPDSWQFYFKDLKGEKHLRYVPNADHSLRNSDALQTVAAFYECILNGRSRPEYSWTMEKDGAIRVQVKSHPDEVRLWYAVNPEARDFRLEKIGPAYQSKILTPQRDGTYVAKVGRPERGWMAYFVELTFPGGGNYPLKFTTGVRVQPDTLPFPPPNNRNLSSN